MKREIKKCRQMSASSLRRRQLAVTELLRHARVVSDPQKMAALNAAVARRKTEISKS